MQAYYDEKLKRWIFPGDDPAEVAKPMAPPPIIHMNVNAAPATPAPAAAGSNDPLAALMAPPPSRSVLSMKKGMPTATSRHSNPVDSGVKKGVPPASPMMTTPNFAVFQPRPTSGQTPSDPI
jgi:hypothetical protein